MPKSISSVSILSTLPTHKKTRKLKDLAGHAGLWSLICLFAWASEHAPDGRIVGYTDEQIAHFAHWESDPVNLIASLRACGFIDLLPGGGYCIHDWADANPKEAPPMTRAEICRAAAVARWNKEATKPPPRSRRTAQAVAIQTGKPVAGPAPKQQAAPLATPACPVQKIVEIYHQELPMLPGVRVLGESTRKQITTRWREDKKRQSLEWWTKYFRYVATHCHFLTGRVNDFTADFTWLVGPKNFEKVINGRYDVRKKDDAQPVQVRA